MQQCACAVQARARVEGVRRAAVRVRFVKKKKRISEERSGAALDTGPELGRGVRMQYVLLIFVHKSVPDKLEIDRECLRSENKSSQLIVIESICTGGGRREGKGVAAQHTSHHGGFGGRPWHGGGGLRAPHEAVLGGSPGGPAFLLHHLPNLAVPPTEGCPAPVLPPASRLR